MGTRAKVAVIGAVVVLLATASFLRPRQIVARHLPAQYATYRSDLVRGFWLLRGMMVVDAALCVAALVVVGRSPRSRENLEHGRRVARWEVIAVAGVTLLAAGLRVAQLRSGLGYDEIYISSAFINRGIVATAVRAEPWRSLYPLLGNVVRMALGPSELTSRIPAYMFGVASIPALYMVARRWIGAGAALLAALMLSVSTFHIWYSQEATSYSMAMFFGIVSIGLFETALKKDGAGEWGWWTVATFFLLYSHFMLAVFLLCMEGAWAVLVAVAGCGERRRWEAVARASLGVLCASAAFLTVTAVAWPTAMTELKHANGNEFRGALADNLLFVGKWLFQPFGPRWVEVLGLAMAGWGTFLLGRRRPWLAVCLWLPAAVPVILFAVGAMGFLTPRYVIVGLLPVVVSQGIALSSLGEAAWRRRREVRNGRGLGFASAAVATLAVALPLGYGTASAITAFDRVERYPFRPACRYILDHGGAAGERAVVFGGYGFDKFSFYLTQMESAPSYAELDDFLSRHERCWFVYYLPAYWERMPKPLRGRIERGGRLVFHHEGLADQLVVPTDSYVWRVDSGTTAGTGE